MNWVWLSYLVRLDLKIYNPSHHLILSFFLVFLYQKSSLGWCCCDAWQHWYLWGSEQHLVANESMRSNVNCHLLNVIKHLKLPQANFEGFGLIHRLLSFFMEVMRHHL